MLPKISTIQKPTSSNGLPRLSSARKNLVEASTTSQPAVSNPSSNDRVVPTSTRSTVNAHGMTFHTKEIVESGSASQSGNRSQPLLNRRSRILVSFNCSPFETGAVRVANSAPTAPQISREATTLIHSTPYGWVPPIVNAAPELPSRIDPTHPIPPAPQRQHPTWETVDGHYRNEQRSNIMRRLQHINSNEMLAKMYYGTTEEVNGYKQHMRHILKQQMEDQWQKSRKRFHLDLGESNAAIEYDRECLREDARAEWQKRMYLRQFAFDNHQLAEERKQRIAQDRQRELEHERRLLAYNPINWSGTMT